MAAFDFAPLFRSTVGFDRLPNLLGAAGQAEENSFPPYNIERLGDDSYRIILALAGFGPDDVDVVAENNQLTIRGRTGEDGGKTFLHRGIGARAFERKFVLAEFVEVTGASMDNGLLAIELKRELPEKLQPRRIEITSGGEAKRKSRRLRAVAA